MRIPKISNIIIKTIARLQWYLSETLPLFILGTVILFILAKTGLLAVLEDIASPLIVNLLQLPKEAASSFIMGFLRRDYAVVLITKSAGVNLNNLQMLVAIVTITLFVPCIANLFIMIKERGLKVALFITVFIFSFAFLFGALFNFLLRFLQVSL